MSVMFLPTTCIALLLTVVSWMHAVPAYAHRSSTHVRAVHTVLPSPVPLSPTPTIHVTASPSPTLKPRVVKKVKRAAGDSIQRFILSQINEYRTQYGLPAVTTNATTCSFAQARAKEITTNFTHEGFTTRIANHTLPYSSYHTVTENIAMTSDYTKVVTMWKNSSGHAENMRADTPFICVASSGNYYAFEGWKP